MVAFIITVVVMSGGICDIPLRMFYQDALYRLVPVLLMLGLLGLLLKSSYLLNISRRFSMKTHGFAVDAR